MVVRGCSLGMVGVCIFVGVSGVKNTSGAKKGGDLVVKVSSDELSNLFLASTLRVYHRPEQERFSESNYLTELLTAGLAI